MVYVCVELSVNMAIFCSSENLKTQTTLRTCSVKRSGKLCSSVLVKGLLSQCREATERVDKRVFLILDLFPQETFASSERPAHASCMEQKKAITS